MIENLVTKTNIVSWVYNNVAYKLKIENSFFASEDMESEYIQIYSGLNYNVEKEHYFSFRGEKELICDLKTGKVEWIFHNREYKLEIDEIEQIGYFPEKDAILIICGHQNQKLLRYNLQADLLFNVSSPLDFTMKYFSKANDKMLVVCDGNSKETDQFGRFTYNFIIDKTTGKLIKDGIAY